MLPAVCRTTLGIEGQLPLEHIQVHRVYLRCGLVPSNNVCSSSRRLVVRVGRREKSQYVLCTTSCSSEEAARWRQPLRKEASCVAVSPSPPSPPPSTDTRAQVTEGTTNLRELGGREGVLSHSHGCWLRTWSAATESSLETL